MRSRRDVARKDRPLGMADDCESGLRFLVVDDEPAIRDYLGLLLSTEGHAVALADSGASALACLEQQRVHFVLLDLMMPNEHGITTLEKIREADERIPVIIMTGYAETDSAVSALRLRADDYLRKPFRNDELLSAIDRALAHRGIPRSADEWMRKLLGERIRELRQKEGLSQTELADRIGQTPAQISQIERSVCGPSLDTCLRLSRALRVSMSELFAGL